MSSKKLLIVESPAKAKTIEGYLGKDYIVKSCYGHVRDLEKKKMGIDVDDNYKPFYIIQEDKKEIIDDLKKLLGKIGEVWLATDEDREGEAISWHLCEALDLDPEKTKRIVFHEITKRAIQKAVKNPRKVDMDLVNAQQARRILDRIVGFKLSPLLRNKLTYKQTLSAGRVQSVAAKIIVEKEKEIREFKSAFTYKIEATFEEKDNKNTIYRFKATTKNFKEEPNAYAFLESCKGAIYKVEDITVKEVKMSPQAPFSTSTLQQEASQKLGYLVGKTMSVAQQLYEKGFITYMRTDSIMLSEFSLQEIQHFVQDNYGNEYYKKRVFKNKNTSAQEAHEAIRPTNVSVEKVPESLQSLYSLIRKRTLASQMADAKFDKTQVRISISTNDAVLLSTGKVLTFSGFLKLYGNTEPNDKENSDITERLPKLEIGQILHFQFLTATQTFQREPSRYNEASLVKKLEELGIGRPSTYAPTITTIQNRNYVKKKNSEGKLRNYILITLKKDNNIIKETLEERYNVEKGKLHPTDLGTLVDNFLSNKFGSIINYEFTSQIEDTFDKIAHGDAEWDKVIDSFYQPFTDKVSKVMKDKEGFSMERNLGTDPETGKDAIARMGAYGPLVQLGEANPDDPNNKPKYAKLQSHQHIDTITLKEALQLFTLPKTLGMFEDNEVIVNIGRFGPFVFHNKVFCSIPKTYDVYTINLDETIGLIQQKRETDAKKFIKSFEKEDIHILNGKYGPYIKQTKNNYKIPKKLLEHVHKLTLEQAQDIIKEESKKPKKGKRRVAKKTT